MSNPGKSKKTTQIIALFVLSSCSELFSNYTEVFYSNIGASIKNIFPYINKKSGAVSHEALVIVKMIRRKK